MKYIFLIFILFGCNTEFEVKRTQYSMFNGDNYSCTRIGALRSRDLALCKEELDCRKVCDIARNAYEGKEVSCVQN